LTALSIRKARNRRRQRGAAMTESAIIAAFMVIQFACMWAAVSYERAKIMVMNEARAEAWAQAIKPCGGGGGDVMGDIGGATGDASSPNMPNTGESNQYIDIGSTSMGKDAGYVTITRQRNVTFPGIIGGKSYMMSSRMHMRCNEPPGPETPWDFFKQAFGVVKGLFGL